MGVDDNTGARVLRPDALPDANQDVNPGTRLGASIAFAFNSPAQGPVTPMGFAVTRAGNRTQDAWILSPTP